VSGEICLGVVLHLPHAVLHVQRILDLNVSIVVHGLLVARSGPSQIVDEGQMQIAVHAHARLVALAQAVEGLHLTVDRTHLEHAEGLVAVVRQGVFVDVRGTVEKQCS
jgi:hypothetical protein